VQLQHSGVRELLLSWWKWSGGGDDGMVNNQESRFKIQSFIQSFIHSFIHSVEKTDRLPFYILY